MYPLWLLLLINRYIRSDARKLFSTLLFPMVILAVVVVVRFAAVPSAHLHGLHHSFVGQDVEAARSAVVRILVPAVAHGAALALEEDVAEAAPAAAHLAVAVVAVPCCGALVADQRAVDDQLGLLDVVAPSAHPHVAQSTLFIQTNIYKQITETILTATREVCFVTIPFTIRFVELQLCEESHVTTKITQNQFRDLSFWKEHHNKINLLLGSGVGGAATEDLYGTFLGLQVEEDLSSSIK